MTSQALAVYTAFNRIGFYNEPSFETDRKALAAALRALDEQLAQHTTAIHTMRDPDFIDEQRNADALDAMVYLEAMIDQAYELEEAMREAEQDGWTGVFNDEISNEERYACDHYNERYVIND
jgi:transposase